MLEWEQGLGKELDQVRRYLRLSNDPAKTFPCTNPLGCGFPHRVEKYGKGRWVAVCDEEDNCPGILLDGKDLLVYEVDRKALCAGIAHALKLEPPAARKSTHARAELAGTHGPGRHEVYLMFPADHARMAREVERLFGPHPAPFILMTPSGEHCTAEVESAATAIPTVVTAASASGVCWWVGVL